MMYELNARRINKLSMLLNTEAQLVPSDKPAAQRAFVQERLVNECAPLSLFDIVTGVCQCELMI